MSITILLIIVIVGISIWAWSNPEILYKFILNPYTIHRRGEWYRMLSAGFIHADYAHLGFNMFSLYFLGEAVEMYFKYIFGDKGAIFYLLLFLLGVIFGNIPDTSRKKNNPDYNALGASGGVSSVVFAFIILSPLTKLSIMFIPIGIPAWIFAILYVAYSNYMAKRQLDNIGHTAHLWGALWGVVFVILLYPTSLSSFIEQIVGSFR